MNKKKVGLFFGAGAEMPYGLPSGGRFALNIFRIDSTPDKNQFKEQIKQVNEHSPYARKWLPDDFKTRPVSVFGKKHYESLIISSLENKRQHIFKFFEDFDINARWVAQDIHKQSSGNIAVDNVIDSTWGQAVGSMMFGGTIKLNSTLNSNIKIFDSQYFSAFLGILKEKSSTTEPWVKKLKDIVRSFIEVLIGAVGEDFLDKINYSIFDKKPDDIDLFDDFYGLFKFDYKSISGLDLVLTERDAKIFNGSQHVPEGEIITEFANRLLDDLFAVALDYQNLLDSYYRYLFCPKTDWGKFSKICIFLTGVHRYITTDLEALEEKIKTGDGYYQDLTPLSKNTCIQAIGTTNYNHFLEFFESDSQKIFYLNGSTDDFYDPYLNKILKQQEASESNHICVPFLFTQSGIKPLTSVTMSRRYVDLFDKFNSSDIIGVVGFSFQADDGHINGLFRELIEEQGKKVVIFHYGGDNNYAEKLRLSSSSHPNLIVENISRDRKCNGVDWYTKLLEHAA